MSATQQEIHAFEESHSALLANNLAQILASFPDRQITPEEAQQVESEFEKHRRYKKFMQQTTQADVMDSHLSREVADLTGTHHELDGFVHNDPHDAFPVQDVVGGRFVNVHQILCDWADSFSFQEAAY
jgi:hypothetical protein